MEKRHMNKRSQYDLDHEKNFPYRQFGFHGKLGQPYPKDGSDPVAVPVNADKADLIISRTTSGMHAPALDIDFPARLVPSRTKGHFHLYLDEELPWEKYKKLLEALAEAGIIEHGFAQASIKRGYSSLRWSYEKQGVDEEERKNIISDLKDILGWKKETADG